MSCGKKCQSTASHAETAAFLEKAAMPDDTPEDPQKDLGPKSDYVTFSVL